MRRTDEDGAVAVEFALLVPVLLVLLLGIIDFGFAFNSKVAVTQAAREGVRVVALGGSEPDATDRVNDALTNNGQVLPVSTTFPTSCSGGSDTATVQVAGSYDPILPIPVINLTAQGVMQCNG